MWWRASAPEPARSARQPGLLDGRRCCTHHALQDDLGRRFQAATVVKDVLFTVHDDQVLTSAGIASDVDVALHIVATRNGLARPPRWPAKIVVYARRSGAEPQASTLLTHRNHLDDTVHQVQDLIDARFTESLPLTRLATAAG